MQIIDLKNYQIQYDPKNTDNYKVLQKTGETTKDHTIYTKSGPNANLITDMITELIRLHS